jgi:hypothetical protein
LSSLVQPVKRTNARRYWAQSSRKLGNEPKREECKCQLQDFEQERQCGPQDAKSEIHHSSDVNVGIEILKFRRGEKRVVCDLLRKTWLWVDLSGKDVESIVKASEECEHEAGDIILKKGRGALASSLFSMAAWRSGRTEPRFQDWEKDNSSVKCHFWTINLDPLMWSPWNHVDVCSFQVRRSGSWFHVTRA